MERKPQVHYEVQIVEMATDTVFDAIDCERMTFRSVEKVERGVNINLNHEKFYTRIADKGGE